MLSAATLPTYGLKSVEELVKKRFPRATRVNTDLMHRHHPRLTQAFFEVRGVESGYGSESSAPRPPPAYTPSSKTHQPTTTQAPEALEGKIAMLLALLAKVQAKHQQGNPDGGPPLPKTMVFLNTASAAQAAYEAVAAAGYPAVPFHKEVRLWVLCGCCGDGGLCTQQRHASRVCRPSIHSHHQ